MRKFVNINRKMLIISIILLFVTGIVLATTYDVATDIGKNYKIAGRIEDANGNLISNCKVELIGNNYSKVIDIQDGKFEYENLPTGKYKLKLTYDTNQYKVDSITRNKQNTYSLGNDYSICLMYPKNSDEVYRLVDDIANKLNHIANNNGFKTLKIYQATYENQEELDEAAKKVLQDRKNSKLIVAFTNNKEFIEKCKEKQEKLSVQPNIAVSSPYRILGIYLNGDITEYMDGLYNNFFIGYQGEINKQAILEEIYKIYNNNIQQMSRDEQINIDFTENMGYTETEEIEINTSHDNDTTNSIVIKLKDKSEPGNATTQPENNGTNQTNPNITQIEPNIGLPPIEVTIPSSDPSIPPTITNVKVEIEKKVKAVRLILSDGSVLIDEQTVKWSIPDKLKVISLDEELMHGAIIQIEYEMTVFNKSSDFKLKDVVLYDCLNYQYNNNIVYDPNLAFLTDENKNNIDEGWESKKIGSKDFLKTTIDEIPAGSEATKKLIISKVISAEKDEMYYENHMMIEELSYTYIYDSTIGGTKQINDIIKNSTLSNVVKSPQIIIIPPTGK